MTLRRRLLKKQHDSSFRGTVYLICYVLLTACILYLYLCLDIHIEIKNRICTFNTHNPFTDFNIFVTSHGCLLYFPITVTSHHLHGVSNHRPFVCLFNGLLRLTWNKNFKDALLALCEGNLPVTGGFPSERASNAENIFISWRHHVND